MGINLESTKTERAKPTRTMVQDWMIDNINQHPQEISGRQIQDLEFVGSGLTQSLIACYAKFLKSTYFERCFLKK